MDITPLLRHRNSWFALALLAGVGLGALDGCDNGPGEKIAEQCGLDIDCEAGGFAEGKASISGVASIDAFFGAAIDLNAAMLRLDGKLRAELDAIGASVGLEPGASGAEIRGAIESHLDGYIQGGLTIDYQPAKCEASIEASVAAAAECDAEVDPGSVQAKCEGACEAEAGVAVDCGADAELRCEGTAPGFACDGTCSGSCVTELSAATECEGTCRGTCEVDGSTMEGFDGRCNGACQGECAVDVSAGVRCDAKCEGSCEYRAPEGGCEANATAHCQANADASIECDAGCEGTVEPPSVSAECEATVEAKASASVECTPPTIAFGFEWNGDAAASLEMQAEFRAWLEGFRAHFGAILAARVEAELVAEAGVALVASTDGALKTAIEDLVANGSLSAAIGAGCALQELPVAASALGSSQAQLTGSITAAGEVVSAF